MAPVQSRISSLECMSIMVPTIQGMLQDLWIPHAGEGRHLQWRDQAEAQRCWCQRPGVCLLLQTPHPGWIQLPIIWLNSACQEIENAGYSDFSVPDQVALGMTEGVMRNWVPISCFRLIGTSMCRSSSCRHRRCPMVDLLTSGFICALPLWPLPRCQQSPCSEGKYRFCSPLNQFVNTDKTH